MTLFLNRLKSGVVEPSKEHYERICEIYEAEYDKICSVNSFWWISLTLKSLVLLQVLLFFMHLDVLQYLIATQTCNILFTIFFCQFNLFVDNKANNLSFSFKDWAQVSLVHPRLSQLYFLVLFSFLQPSNSLPLSVLLISFTVYDSYFMTMCASQNIYLKTKYSTVIEEYLSTVCLSLPPETYKSLPENQKKRLWSSYLQNTVVVIELVLLSTLTTTTLVGQSRIILLVLYFQGLLTKSSIDPFLMKKFKRALNYIPGL